MPTDAVPVLATAHTHLSHRAFKKQYGVVDKLPDVYSKHEWSINCKEVVVLIDGIIYIAENKTGFKLLKDYKVSVDLTTESPTITKVISIPQPRYDNYSLLRFPLYTGGAFAAVMVHGSITLSAYAGPICWGITGACLAIDYFCIAPNQRKANEINKKGTENGYVT